MAKQGLRNLPKMEPAIVNLKDKQNYNEKRGSVSLFWNFYNVYFF